MLYNVLFFISNPFLFMQKHIIDIDTWERRQLRLFPNVFKFMVFGDYRDRLYGGRCCKENSPTLFFFDTCMRFSVQY